MVSAQTISQVLVYNPIFFVRVRISDGMINTGRQ